MPAVAEGSHVAGVQIESEREMCKVGTGRGGVTSAGDRLVSDTGGVTGRSPDGDRFTFNVSVFELRKKGKLLDLIAGVQGGALSDGTDRVPKRLYGRRESARLYEVRSDDDDPTSK